MRTVSTRRRFLCSSGHLVAAGLLATLVSAQETAPPPANVPKPPPKPPALPPEKVEAVVGVSHRSLEKVRELIEEYPLLANASWDWGGGDFETPLQAAAHTGGRDIAEYLLSKNARIDIYGAAMLGYLDFIKAALAVNSQIHEVPGPHGFTLLHCAKQGGPKAKSVYDFLVAQGVPEVFHRPLPFIWPGGKPPT